ncbi:RNA-guided endonuclease InsQ/TnpB family protein [Phormidesmis sp. 146-12]
MRRIKAALGKRFKSRFITVSSLALLLLCSLAICTQFAQSTTPHGLLNPSEPIQIAQAPNLSKAFQELGIDGAIVIYDKNHDRFYEHNPSRNRTAFFPGSTFKILNALISLETGTIRDDVTVLTWDGIARSIPAYVQFCVDVNRTESPEPSGNTVGLDVGLKEYYTDSDGVMIENPKFLRKSEQVLKRSQRRVSRKVKGSNNRRKARQILGLRHLTISRQRKDHAVKLARCVVTSNDVVAYEDLRIKTRLVALFAIAATVSGLVAEAADFSKGSAIK